MSEEFVLTPGYLVQHKSTNSPEMVVEEIVEAEDGERLYCCGWFDARGRFNRDNFRLCELVLVEYRALGAEVQEDD